MEPGAAVRRCSEAQAFCWRTRCSRKGRAAPATPVLGPCPSEEGGEQGAPGLSAGLRGACVMEIKFSQNNT